MDLIIVRHALAENREDFQKKNLPDQFRPLIDKGRKRINLIADKLHNQIEKVDLIVTSPYLRARQTAEILNLKWGGQLVEAPELVPHSPIKAVLRWLKAHTRGCSKVVIVGHDPQLSQFVSYLLSGNESSHFINLKKAGVCLLKVESIVDLEVGKVVLEWHLNPKVFLG